MTAAPTLNDLIEFNREVAGLVRAGIPLELGLESLQGGTSRLDALAGRVSNRLSAGKSLAEALHEEAPAISPVYGAVVEAGLKSNRLPEVLESVAKSASVVQDMRQRLCVAMIYPALCLGLAVLLAGLIVRITVPEWRGTLESFRFPPDHRIQRLYQLQETVSLWSVTLPLIVVLFSVAIYSLRDSMMRPVWQAFVSLQWLPGFSLVAKSLREAQFLEFLALQTEHGIPLESAIALAARATESSELQADAEIVAMRLRSGQPLSEAVQALQTFPASWRWTLTVSQRDGTLPAAIRNLAEAGRHQAFRRAAWFNYMVPASLAIGGSALIVFIYAWVLFLPVHSLWMGLGREP